MICQKITQFLKFGNLELLMVLIIDTKSRISPWESRLCLSSVLKCARLDNFKFYDFGHFLNSKISTKLISLVIRINAANAHAKVEKLNVKFRFITNGSKFYHSKTGFRNHPVNISHMCPISNIN